MARDYKKFTQQELLKLSDMHKAGKSYTEIAEELGRSFNSVRNKICKSDMARRTVPVPAASRPTCEMSPREMIKKLYDMGYRIKDNKLYVIRPVEVKLQDIINE